MDDEVDGMAGDATNVIEFPTAAGDPAPSEPETDIAVIREKVKTRIPEKKKDEDSGSGGEGQITSDFVRACLRTNQHGDGELYKALHRDRFIYCKNRAMWLTWAGHHWAEDIMDEALAAVEDVADSYEAEASKISMTLHDVKDSQVKKGLEALVDDLKKRATQLRGDNRRVACLKFAHTSADPLAIGGDEIDSRWDLLGCKNGVVELETGKFRPGRADDWILKASPYDWIDINHPCPVFKKTILDCMDGDEDMALFLQRLFGIAVSGKVVEKKFPVLIGPRGDNGKTTVVEAISYAMGPLGGPVSSEMIVTGYKPSSSGIDTAMMALKGLRYAYASETEENAKVSAVRVKIMTGKDTLSARSIYEKRQSQWEPTHTLFLLSNYELRADSEDAAFWGRIIYIPFNVRFVADPKEKNERPADPYLAEKLKAEASGILAWLVRGYLMWREQGLKIPFKVIERSRRTRDEMDYFGAFLDECTIKIEDDRLGIGSSELHHFFCKWYLKNIGNFPPKVQTFGKYMKAHYEHKKDGIMRYFGLAINYDAVKVYDPDANPLNYA